MGLLLLEPVAGTGYRPAIITLRKLRQVDNLTKVIDYPWKSPFCETGFAEAEDEAQLNSSQF